MNAREHASQEHTSKLREALQKLEEITSRMESAEPVSEVFRSHVKDPAAKSCPTSLLQKIFSYTLSLFNGESFDKLILNGPVQKEFPYSDVQQVVDMVSKSLPLLHQFQQGTPEQKELAHRVFQAIDQYNAVIDKIAKRISSKAEQSNASVSLIAKKIDMPKPVLATVEHPDQSKVNGAVRSLFSDNVPLHNPLALNPTEADLFKMKAIILLRKQLGVRTAIEAVNSSPIQTIWDDLNISQNLLHAKQTVCTFPGEVSVLTAVFDRSKGNTLLNVTCTPVIKQTGFPDPCQHTGGFVGADCLILTKGGSMHEAFIQRKNELASALLPNGAKNMLGKLWVEKKREAFCSSKKEFLDLHRQLAYTLPVTADHEHHVDNFFEGLSQHSTAFQTLQTAYRILSTQFIERFYHKAQKGDFDVQNELDAVSYELTSVQSLLAKQAVAYIISIGKSLAYSAVRLANEVFDHPFDVKLMLATYQQALNFQDEVLLHDSVNIEDAYESMKASLRHDIALFQTPGLCCEARTVNLIQDTPVGVALAGIFPRH